MPASRASTTPPQPTPGGDLESSPSAVVGEYRCPGEHYSISRAIHLARLADSYPACVHCEFRADTGRLSAARLRRLAAAWQRRGDGQIVHREAIAGRLGEEIDPHLAWTWGAAFGARLTRLSNVGPLRVAIGNDGRGLSAELVHAVDEGVRWSGANTIDCGATSAPGLIFAQQRLRADGALLVGNPLGKVHTVGLRLWGPDARPWSSPGQLDDTRQLAVDGVERPSRSSGACERHSLHASYVETFRESFHALRRVKFILGTPCATTEHDILLLLENVGCRMLLARRDTANSVSHRESPHPIDSIGRQVRDERADFGIRIDDDGESCRVCDESGTAIAGESLLVALVERVVASVEEPARIVVEEEINVAAIAALKRRGFQVKLTAPTRQAMYDQLGRHAIAIGGGSSGRYWLDAGKRSPDALATLARLLQLLSTSDRPLSRVIAEALAPPVNGR